jgi:hypothetical protein
MGLLRALQIFMLIAAMAIPYPSNAQSLNQLLNKGFQLLEKELKKPDQQPSQTQHTSPVQTSNSAQKPDSKDCSKWEELGYDSEDLCEYFINKPKEVRFRICDEKENLGYDNYEACSYDVKGRMKKLGFSDYDEYHEAIDLGYKDFESYSAAKLGGFSDKAAFERARAAGFSNAQEYAAAVKGGFKSGTEYKEANSAGFSDKAAFERARAAGFSNAQEYAAAVKGGFKSGTEYKEANSAGFSDKATFDRARTAGFSNAQEFAVAVKGGFKSKSEYKEATKAGFKDKRSYVAALKAKQKGFSSEKNYQAASKGGFRNERTFKDAKAAGFKTLKSYEAAQAAGFSKGTEYFAAVKGGFKTASEYRMAAAVGFRTLKSYEAARAAGFSKAKEYAEAMKGGFKTESEYKEATAGGFKNQMTFTKAITAGFIDANEYRTARKLGFDQASMYKKAMDGKFISKTEFDKASNLGFKTRENFLEGKKLELSASCLRYYTESQLLPADWTNQEQRILIGVFAKYVAEHSSSIDLTVIAKRIRATKSPNLIPKILCEQLEWVRSNEKMFEIWEMDRRKILANVLERDSSEMSSVNASITVKIGALKTFAVDKITEEVGLDAIALVQKGSVCVDKIEEDQALPVYYKLRKLEKCDATLTSNVHKLILSRAAYPKLSESFLIEVPQTDAASSDSERGQISTEKAPPPKRTSLSYNLGEKIKGENLQVIVLKYHKESTIKCGYSEEVAPVGSLYIGIYYSAKNLSDKPANFEPEFQLWDPVSEAFLNSDTGASYTYAVCLDRWGNTINRKVISELNPGIETFGSVAFNISAEHWNKEKSFVRFRVPKGFFSRGTSFDVTFLK